VKVLLRVRARGPAPGVALCVTRQFHRLYRGFKSSSACTRGPPSNCTLHAHKSVKKPKMQRSTSSCGFAYLKSGHTTALGTWRTCERMQAQKVFFGAGNVQFCLNSCAIVPKPLCCTLHIPQTAPFWGHFANCTRSCVLHCGAQGAGLHSAPPVFRTVPSRGRFRPRSALTADLR
jgi:hypothetical protein